MFPEQSEQGINFYLEQSKFLPDHIPCRTHNREQRVLTNLVLLLYNCVSGTTEQNSLRSSNLENFVFVSCLYVIVFSFCQLPVRPGEARRAV